MKSEIRIVGLTGGIAAGKSLVAEILKGFDIPVINLDTVGRQVLNAPPAEVRSAIVGLLGPSVDVGGDLDRHKMREIIFASPEKRKALEKILHPIIWKRFLDHAEQLGKTGTPLVVCEAALMVEAGFPKPLAELILVTAPESVRRDRLKTREPIPEEVLEGILKAQLPDEEKMKKASHVIVNDGPPEQLKARVSEVIQRWVEKGWIK